MTKKSISCIVIGVGSKLKVGEGLNLEKNSTREMFESPKCYFMEAKMSLFFTFCHFPKF
jgi:hypothetical protein